MKIVFTVILAITFCTLSFSQVPGYKPQAKSHLFRTTSKIPGKLNTPGMSLIQAKAYQLKSAAAATQQLDSMVRPSAFKEYYIYDNNKNMAQVYYFEWKNNQWVNDDHEDYFYGTNGKVSYYIDYSWNSTENKWENSDKEYFTYDTNNNLILTIDSIWNTDRWVNYEKTENTYNTNNSLLNAITYHKNTTDNTWVEYRKEKNYYAGEKLDSTYFFNFSESAWDVNSKETFTYWANGKTKNSTNSSFINDMWALTSKSDYTYNPAGNVTEEVYSRMATNNWQYYTKDTFGYDANGNLYSDTYYKWDQDGQKWTGDYKDLNFHDNNYAKSDLIMPFYYSEGDYVNLLFKHKLLYQEEYSFDAGNWIFDDKITLYYTDLSTSKASFAKDDNTMALFPNPASNSVTVNLQGTQSHISIEIYNAQGQLIKSEKTENGKAVSLENMKNGIYFYKLTGGTISVTGKLLKK